MIRQLVLNYMLAIFISKKGDRSNNVQVQNAGRYKFPNISMVSITPSTKK